MVGQSVEGPGMIDLLTSFRGAEIVLLLECPRKRNQVVLNHLDPLALTFR
jgi:hypothetical protein